VKKVYREFLHVFRRRISPMSFATIVAKTFLWIFEIPPIPEILC